MALTRVKGAVWQLRDNRLGTDIVNFGGVGDDATDNTAAFAAALTSSGVNRPVALLSGDYNVVPKNFFSGASQDYQDALGYQYVVGDSSNPATRDEPILWLDKTSSTTRVGNPGAWDQGGVYSSLRKVAGTSFGVSLTGYVSHEGGEGDMIGVHGRGNATHEDAEVWGGWSYGEISGGAVATGAESVMGHEVNIVNRGPDIGWQVDTALNNTRGLVVVSADGSNPVTHAMLIGKSSSAPLGNLYTGIVFRASSIAPTTEPETEVGNNEVLRIEGSTAGSRYNGLRFRSGFMRVGVSFTETEFNNNCAILLGDDQRITVGLGPANTTYLQFNRTSNFVNFENLSLRVNSTQVLTSRRTGWSNPTGTADRTAFNTATVTLEELAQRVKALLDDSITHGFLGS